MQKELAIILDSAFDEFEAGTNLKDAIAGALDEAVAKYGLSEELKSNLAKALESANKGGISIEETDNGDGTVTLETEFEISPEEIEEEFPKVEVEYLDDDDPRLEDSVGDDDDGHPLEPIGDWEIAQAIRDIPDATIRRWAHEAYLEIFPKEWRESRARIVNQIRDFNAGKPSVSISDLNDALRKFKEVSKGDEFCIDQYNMTVDEVKDAVSKRIAQNYKDELA